MIAGAIIVMYTVAVASVSTEPAGLRAPTVQRHAKLRRFLGWVQLAAQVCAAQPTCKSPLGHTKYDYRALEPRLLSLPRAPGAVAARARPSTGSLALTVPWQSLATLRLLMAQCCRGACRVTAEHGIRL